MAIVSSSQFNIATHFSLSNKVNVKNCLYYVHCRAACGETQCAHYSRLHMRS